MPQRNSNIIIRLFLQVVSSIKIYLFSNKTLLLRLANNLLLIKHHFLSSFVYILLHIKIPYKMDTFSSSVHLIGYIIFSLNFLIFINYLLFITQFQNIINFVLQNIIVFLCSELQLIRKVLRN